ncbi:molybdenum cofactor biosynthesis protein MoaC /MOSC-domain-containing protein [uncultured Roseburia sp.]|uniref:MOSC domain-containing protein n=1 Tax=Brotonthovivens ammoniilytica TaxID=2981725 RepID=A0ABT2TFQ0_9FIRM|nr:MOSC domain-containing protein [Brotonthovivens ammoniilytica]MCU6760721.1 MOSC domain-containing protein [Brotonthovivens ammoniilytica]SCI07021.1 molybdenum cofactor biosynthesis protein MoaC /MOSC-domain-containing protein [uncultured Roseburia sp.]
MSNCTVHSICIAQERGQLKKEIEQANIIENTGIEGDGHCGDWGRQVTCLNWESVLKSNQEHGLSMGPGDFAENICIEHMDDLNLQEGDRFLLGSSAVLEVTQIGKPDHPSVVTRTFGVTLLPYEGRFCKVVKGGVVKPGDSVIKL